MAPTPLKLVPPPEVSAAEGGAALTFRGMFTRYGPYIARIGLRLLGRPAEVDDLVQDVFLLAHRQLSALKDPNAAKSWLATIAVRLARRRLRMRRFRELFLPDDPDASLEVADSGATAADRLLLAQLYRALDGVSADARIAWTLRFVEGNRIEEVATLCGCSLATAKRRIAQAQAHLDLEMTDG